MPFQPSHDLSRLQFPDAHRRPLGTEALHPFGNRIASGRRLGLPRVHHRELEEEAIGNVDQQAQALAGKRWSHADSVGAVPVEK